MRNDLPDINAIRASIHNDFLLGKGNNASVYDIIGHPEYALKITTRSQSGAGNALIASPESASIKGFRKSEDRKLAGHNFGQAVARYCDGEIEILLKVAGIPCGVPPYLRDYGSDPLPKASQDRMYLTSMERLAAMPQEAYTQLLGDMRFLNSVGYAFDPTKGNNLLVDTEEGVFRLIDLIKMNGDNTPNNLLTMMCDYSYQAIWEDKWQDRLNPHFDAILDKLLTGCEELGIPFYDEHPENKHSVHFGSAAQGTPQRWDLVRRMQKLHGGNADMPVKQSRICDDYDNYERWKNIYEDATGEKFPMTYRDALKLEAI